MTISSGNTGWWARAANTGSAAMKVNLEGGAAGASGFVGFYDNETGITRTYNMGELSGGSGGLIWANPTRATTSRCQSARWELRQLSRAVSSIAGWIRWIHLDDQSHQSRRGHADLERQTSTPAHYGEQWHAGSGRLNRQERRFGGSGDPQRPGNLSWIGGGGFGGLGGGNSNTLAPWPSPARSPSTPEAPPCCGLTSRPKRTTP